MQSRIRDSGGFTISLDTERLGDVETGRLETDELLSRAHLAQHSVEYHRYIRSIILALMLAISISSITVHALIISERYDVFGIAALILICIQMMCVMILVLQECVTIQLNLNIFFLLSKLSWIIDAKNGNRKKDLYKKTTTVGG